MARTIVAGARTIVWTAAFFIGSLLISIAAATAGNRSRPVLLAIVRGWAIWHRGCARWLVGQQVRIEGDMPDGPAFLVIKHEAMFETIDLLLFLHHPVVFAKRELFSIPLWGMMALRYGLIPIEREAGASALRAMRRAAQAAIAAGRPIVLFPEGTRVPHGQAPSIRSGFAGIYKLLAMPVVPVAVDSGRLFSHGWIRHPGTITYRVGPTIPPHLPRDQAEALAHGAINALNGDVRPTGG